MTCMETQNKITLFINDQLDMATAEGFLSHIESCPSCREELEVYYALLTAMKQLDEDKELSTDYNAQLNKKIAWYEEKFRHIKVVHVRKRFYLLFLAILFVMISSIQFGKDTFTEINTQPSSFELEYNGVPSFMNPLTQMMEEYDQGAIEYINQVRTTRNRMRRKLLEDLRKTQLGYRQQIK
ncbi:MAG: zf-HC2 domain-containing protein [Lachnospiraceae bacterium]|nr:zf-HC2 domain-containing protein [Lachnospiraceae bacterium]